ncbi:MAG: acyltransferase domain-containing protein [Kiritimatiellae bacterium]|nr:acyltransferase domain-containing protein [Kiritimatiellia bacterium]
MDQSLNFAAVIKAAGIPEQGAIWANTWPDSQPSFRLNELYFFQPRWMDEALAKLKMPETINTAFRQARPFFAQHPALQRLAWHCCHLLYQTRFDPAALKTWPPMPTTLGPDEAMFYAFICLAGLPHLERLHRQRGIDPAITYDTAADFALWMEHYHGQSGVWGLSNTILRWVYGYLSGALVKLGRLQYCPGKFPYDFHVYRRRRDPSVLMLAGDGMQFRPDGQFDGANQITAGAQCWTSRWSTTPTEVNGNSISHSGVAQPKIVTLPTAEWDEVLTQQSPILEVHIPATGPLTHEACIDSLRRSRAFFPVHYPEVNFCAFTCVSWLMDNQFDRYLPESSNILQFQRNFYLHPVPRANDKQTYERVFGRSYENIDDAPQTTSLQRILVAHVKAGGRWHSGGGFILREGAGAGVS